MTAVCLLAACGSSSSSSTPAASSGGASSSGKSPIVVGVDQSLTGSNAAFGRGEVALAKGAADYINATGGVGGHPIALKVMDSGEIGSGNAASDTIQMRQAHAVAILGPAISNDCVTVQPIVDSAKIPSICNFANSNQIDSTSSYIFEGNGFETGLVSPMIQFLKDQSGKANPRISVLTNYTLGATDFGTKFKNIAKQEGVTLASFGTMSQTATSVASYVSQIAAAKPDAVAVEVFPDFVKPLVEGLRGAGIKAPIVTTIASADYPILVSLKDKGLFTTEGANMLFPGKSTNSAAVNTLLSGLSKAGVTTASQINENDGPTALSSDLYLLESLKACGPSCTGPQLVKQMESTPFSMKGFVANMQYRPTAHSDHTTYSFWGWNPTSKQVVNPRNKTYPAGSLSLTSP